MNRREMLGLVCVGVFAVRQPGTQEQAPEFSALDHIEFYVSNVEKSRDFFVRVFGGENRLERTLLSRNNKRYLKLGESYMAFEQPRGNSGEIKVDHVSLAIKGLEMPKLHDFLDQRGISYQDYPSGRDTAVVDPDGIRIQLSPEKGWSLLNPATFLPEVVPISEDPIFRPLAIHEVMLNVDDKEKAAAFYQKFLGAPTKVLSPVVQPGANPVWFRAGTSYVGLQQVPTGQKPGVNYWSVTARAFARDDASRRLQQLGAKVETLRTTMEVEIVRFRDPDGALIQVVGSQK